MAQRPPAEPTRLPTGRSGVSGGSGSSPIQLTPAYMPLDQYTNRLYLGIPENTNPQFTMSGSQISPKQVTLDEQVSTIADGSGHLIRFTFYELPVSQMPIIIGREPGRLMNEGSAGKVLPYSYVGVQVNYNSSRIGRSNLTIFQREQNGKAGNYIAAGFWPTFPFIGEDGRPIQRDESYVATIPPNILRPMESSRQQTIGPSMAVALGKMLPNRDSFRNISYVQIASLANQAAPGLNPGVFPLFVLVEEIASKAASRTSIQVTHNELAGVAGIATVESTGVRAATLEDVLLVWGKPNVVTEPSFAQIKALDQGGNAIAPNYVWATKNVASQGRTAQKDVVAIDTTRLLADRSGTVTLLIGRDATALRERASESQLKDPYLLVLQNYKDVSACHAALVYNIAPDRSQQLSIMDLNSSNGTYVNGQRIQPRDPIALQHGMTVSIANLPHTTFKVALPKSGVVTTEGMAPNMDVGTGQGGATRLHQK